MTEVITDRSLVFLHGKKPEVVDDPYLDYEWFPAVGATAIQAGYSISCVEFPDMTMQQPNIDTWSAAFESTLERQTRPKADLIAYSAGGYVAMRKIVEQLSGQKPEEEPLIDRVVLVNPWISLRVKYRGFFAKPKPFLRDLKTELYVLYDPYATVNEGDLSPQTLTLLEGVVAKPLENAGKLKGEEVASHILEILLPETETSNG